MTMTLAKRYFPSGCTVAEFARAFGLTLDVRERVRIHEALKVAGLLKCRKSTNE